MDSNDQERSIQLKPEAERMQFVQAAQVKSSHNQRKHNKLGDILEHFSALSHSTRGIDDEEKLSNSRQALKDGPARHMIGWLFKQ